MDTTNQQKTATPAAPAAKKGRGDVLSDPLAATELSDPLMGGGAAPAREEGAELPVEPAASYGLEEDVIVFEKLLSDLEELTWSIYYRCEVYNTGKAINDNTHHIGIMVRNGHYNLLKQISVYRTLVQTEPVDTMDGLINRARLAGALLDNLVNDMSYLVATPFAEDFDAFHSRLVADRLQVMEHHLFLQNFKADLAKGFFLPE